MLRETENTSAMTKLITPAVKMMLRIASEMSVSAYSTSTWHCGQRLFPRLAFTCDVTAELDANRGVAGITTDDAHVVGGPPDPVQVMTEELPAAR